MIPDVGESIEEGEANENGNDSWSWGNDGDHGVGQ